LIRGLNFLVWWDAAKPVRMSRKSGVSSDLLCFALHLKKWDGRKLMVVIPNHLPEIVRAPWGSTSPWRINRERVIVESTVPFAR
jgi:hypothetical protein